MDWLGSLISAGAQTALGYSNLAYQMQRDSGLTGAEREANAFSAQQAEIARDWQEKFYNQYESPQAMIRQAQEAGINPAAIFGNAMGGSAPSASAPTSIAPKGGDVGGAVAQLAALSKQIAEIDLIKAQTKESGSKQLVNEETARKIGAEISKLAADEEAVRKSLDVMDAEITEKEALAALHAAQAVFSEAQANNLDAQTIFQNWRTQVAKFLGQDPLNYDRKLGSMSRFVFNFMAQGGGNRLLEEAVDAWNDVVNWMTSEDSSLKNIFYKQD